MFDPAPKHEKRGTILSRRKFLRGSRIGQLQAMTLGNPLKRRDRELLAANPLKSITWTQPRKQDHRLALRDPPRPGPPGGAEIPVTSAQQNPSAPESANQAGPNSWHDLRPAKQSAPTNSVTESQPTHLDD